MAARSWGIALALALLLAVLFGSGGQAQDRDGRRWPGESPRLPGPAFAPAQGQEVVAGSYRCSGTVFTDEQSAYVSTYNWITATSGIADGFYAPSLYLDDLPRNLEVLAGICEAHVSAVIAQMPSICALGPQTRRDGESSNAQSTDLGFDFSCQGTRDQAVGVIGALSRLALTLPLR